MCLFFKLKFNEKLLSPMYHDKQNIIKLKDRKFFGSGKLVPECKL